MVFANLDDLLHMNGHGPYVWVSYGVASVVLAWLVFAPLWRHRRIRADIARQARRVAATAVVRESIDDHFPEK